MKNLKNTFATITLMAVMTFGTTFANAGIIIAGLNDGGRTRTEKQTPRSEPCGTTNTDSKSDLGGIIIAGYAGIIIAGLTGIIIAGLKDEPTVNCGIIIAG